jgi:hypothetical protein
MLTHAENLPPLPTFFDGTGGTKAGALPLSSAGTRPREKDADTAHIERSQRDSYARFAKTIVNSTAVQQGVEAEFDQLVHSVRNVESLTDPHHESNDKESETRRVRTNAITLGELTGRMVRHVRMHLNPDADDHQQLIASAVFTILRRIVEGELGHHKGGQVPIMGGAEEELRAAPVMHQALLEVYIGAKHSVSKWQFNTCESEFESRSCFHRAYQAMRSLVDKHKPPPMPKLKRNILNFQNSTSGLIFMITCVAASLAIGAGEVDTREVVLLGCLLGIFFVDSMLRLWCMGKSKFCKDVLCMLELLCTLADFTLSMGVVGLATDGRNVARAGRGLRVLRVLRLFRIIRITRVFHALTTFITRKMVRQNSEYLATRNTSEMQLTLCRSGALKLALEAMAMPSASSQTFAAAAQVAIRLLECQNREAQEQVLEFLGTGGGDNLLARFEIVLSSAAKNHQTQLASAGASAGAYNTSWDKRTHFEHVFLGMLAPNPDARSSADPAAKAQAHQDAQCVLICRFLQQACEGHFPAMQRAMFSQDRRGSVNVIGAVVKLVQSIARSEAHLTRHVTIDQVQVMCRGLSFIIDAVQSTSVLERSDSQRFVCECGLLSTMNQILSVHMQGAAEVLVKDVGGVAMLKPPVGRRIKGLNWSVSAKQLKGLCATLLNALVEGCADLEQFQLLASSISPHVLAARRKQLFLMAQYLRDIDGRSDHEDAGAIPDKQQELNTLKSAPTMTPSELASLRRLILWVSPDNESEDGGTNQEQEERQMGDDTELVAEALAPGFASSWEHEFLSEGDELFMFSMIMTEYCPAYDAARSQAATGLPPETHTRAGRDSNTVASALGLDAAARRHFKQAVESYREVNLACSLLEKREKEKRDEKKEQEKETEKRGQGEGEAEAEGGSAKVEKEEDGSSEDEDGPDEEGTHPTSDAAGPDEDTEERLWARFSSVAPQLTKSAQLTLQMRMQRRGNRAKADKADLAFHLVLKTGARFMSLIGCPGWRQFKDAARDAGDQIDRFEAIPQADKDITEMVHKCKYDYNRLLQMKTFMFFSERSRSVEVVWDGTLRKVFFAMPTKGPYIESQLDIITAPYSSFIPRDKLGEFVERASATVAYSEPIEWLDSIFPLPFGLFGSLHAFTRNIATLEWISFGIAVIAAINMLLGLNYDSVQAEACWINECPVYVNETASATNSTRRLARRSSSSGGAGSASGETFVDADVMEWAPLSELHFALSVGQLACCIALFAITVVNRSPTTIHGHWMGFARRYNMLPRHLRDDFVQWFVAMVPYVVVPLVVFAPIETLLVLRWQGFQEVALYIPAFTIPVLLLWRTRVHLEEAATIPGLVFVIAFDLFMDGVQVRNALFLAFAIMSLFGTHQYHFVSTQLFRVVALSPTLLNVFRAVVIPAKKLVLTGLLAMCVIFVMAIVAFLDFNTEMESEEGGALCTNLIECFGYVLHKCSLAASSVLPESATNGISYASEPGLKMALFDLLFFMVVVIVLTNFIFGILIDTFASLREEREAQDEQTDDYCFICSKPRGAWVNSSAFEQHTSEEHAQLDYVYFMLHIDNKRADQLTGCEQYVQTRIKESDPDWFPIEMSLGLKDHETEIDLEAVAIQMNEQQAQQQAWMAKQEASMVSIESQQAQQQAQQQAWMAKQEASMAEQSKLLQEINAQLAEGKAATRQVPRPVPLPPLAEAAGAISTGDISGVIDL